MGDQLICNNKKIEQMAVVTIAASLAALEQLKDGRIAGSPQDGRHINSTQNCRINRLILIFIARDGSTINFTQLVPVKQ
jgi:hypothetical protein